MGRACPLSLSGTESTLPPLGVPTEGVRTVVDNKETSIAVAIGVAAIGLRGPRRFLWRHTLGRLRSEEAVFKSAELRSVVLAEKVEGQALELKKLQVGKWCWGWERHTVREHLACRILLPEPMA